MSYSNEKTFENLGSIGIKKMDDLDNLFEGYKDVNPEDRKDISVNSTSSYASIHKVLNEFESLDELTENHRWHYWPETILTPEEISQTLDFLIQFGYDQTNKGYMSPFISKLIQNSYGNGYNNFNLDLKETALDSFGRSLVGTRDNPMNLSISGSLGRISFNYANYVKCFIEGNVGVGTLQGSNHSTFIIEGKVRGNFGTNSNYLNATIGILKEKLIGKNSNNSTYATSNLETLEILKQLIPTHDRYHMPTRNNVYFIDENKQRRFIPLIR